MTHAQRLMLAFILDCTKQTEAANAVASDPDDIEEPGASLFALDNFIEDPDTFSEPQQHALTLACYELLAVGLVTTPEEDYIIVPSYRSRIEHWVGDAPLEAHIHNFRTSGEVMPDPDPLLQPLLDAIRLQNFMNGRLR